MSVSKKRTNYGSSKNGSNAMAASAIMRRHAAPAMLMAVAGIALSLVIADLPSPSFTAYAAPVENTSEEEYTKLDELSFVTSEDVVSVAQGIEAEAADNSEALNDEALTQEVENVEFLSYVTSLSAEETSKKLAEIEAEKKRQQEKEKIKKRNKVSAAAVVSSNKSLYAENYYYGASGLPMSENGANPVNSDGVAISGLSVPSYVQLDENGVPVNYSYCLEGSSTAYYGGSLTATGTTPRTGTVAVDPRKIPYGSELYIVSSDGRYVYGYCRAEDTGGFIYNSNTIVDLYMDHYSQCVSWGRRNVKVYVLK